MARVVDMARVMEPSPTNPELHIEVIRLVSGCCRRPLLHLLQDTNESRRRYMAEGVPLQKFALSGNWKEARVKLEGNTSLMKTAITKGWATTLHVAAAADQVHFVKELVKLMEANDLELQDYNGNTAFFLAAGVGNLRLVKIMLDKNGGLPMIRGQKGLTALHFAVIQKKDKMAMSLYNETIHMFQGRDWKVLFLTSINAGMYDLAMKIIQQNSRLATVRDRLRNTGLHLLARRKLTKSVVKHTQVLQLVRHLWEIILTTRDSESEISEIINNPSPLVFDAILIENYEFLAELMSIYPDLIWEKDYKGRSIIHFAVEHRHARIFNLIHEIGSMKDFIISSTDADKNTLLHVVAKLAPTDQLNLVSGAAFQLTLELIWFEGVKRIMVPFNVEDACNSQGLTPRELFTEQHENLRRLAEKWMKGTAKSCIIVSTVIATGVLSAAFSLLDSIKDKTGISSEKEDNIEIRNDLKEPEFSIFFVSDGLAFILSAISTLFFLSILFSRYAVSDFYMKLPLKLIVGLITLFISISSMMVAFSSALFITYNHVMNLVPISISILAFLLIPLFGFLQYSLWSDIFYSAYYCRYLFRPNKADALLGR